MRVLVTGGGGYIGSILCRTLVEKGYDVTALDRFFFGVETLSSVKGRIRIVKDDVRWFDPKLLDGVDAVFDMAALSNDVSGELDKSKTLEINHKGRARVAQLAKKHNVSRYVLASSCSVYGFQDSIVNEKSGLNPLTTYAKANALAEQDAFKLSDDKFTVTALRQATVYGLSPRMRFDLAVNVMVLSLFREDKLMITGDGKQWRPFVHVRDTGNAFIKVLEAEREKVSGETFNVGTNEQNFTIIDLAKLICKSIGYEPTFEQFGYPDFRSYHADFTKIKETLNFKAEFTPKDGSVEIFNALKEKRLDPSDPRTITVNWYKQLIKMQEQLKNVELNGVIL